MARGPVRGGGPFGHACPFTAEPTAVPLSIFDGPRVAFASGSRQPLRSPENPSAQPCRRGYAVHEGASFRTSPPGMMMRG